MTRTRLSFALSRNDFIEHLYKILDGALGEYYKAAVASLIGETLYVSHWQEEVEDHIEVFTRTLLRPTKAKFNRLTALEVVLTELESQDLSFRKSAFHRLRGERYRYTIPKSITPDHPKLDEASQAFFAKVRRMARESLS